MERGRVRQALTGGGFDAVIVDNALPGYSSKEVIKRAKDTHPDVPVIVCSGRRARR
ncbi:MAG TPA: hypothetical protein VFO35_21795 [Steroidobacteraceae bacterium]|nr:hypothetical protein [Steroidobacteraceae bacterium]